MGPNETTTIPYRMGTCTTSRGKWEVRLTTSPFAHCQNPSTWMWGLLVAVNSLGCSCAPKF